MANKDLPRGLVPFGRILRMSPYVAGAAVYPGDLVKMDNTGRIVVSSAGTSAAIGVAATYASAAAAEVMVWDDPEQLFLVQSDDATDPDAQTDVGLNYNLIATAGDATYKQSRMELDGSTGATDSNLPFRLIQIDRTVDNAAGGYADCVVVINNHQLSKNSAGL